MKNADMHTLGVKLGFIFGIALVTLVILNVALGIGGPIIVLLGSLYHGYAATLLGAIMGFIWGFIHGYVVGALVVLVRRLFPKL